MDAPSIVCTLSEPALRERRAGLLQRVRGRVLEVLPLARESPSDAPDDAAAGFALRFGGDEETVADLLELVRLESRCCAFLRFRLTLEPAAGPVTLEISGPPGGAELLAVELFPSAGGAPGTVPA